MIMSHAKSELVNFASATIAVEEIPRLSFQILLVLITSVILPFVVLHAGVFREELEVLRALMDQSFFSFLFRMVWVPTVFLSFAIIGIALHEFIHALFFSFFLPSRFQGIKFGFDDQHGIPFVHIREPISVLGFRIGAIMPLILLGVIPIVVGMYYGSISLTLFGALFTISASGDLLLIAKSRGIPPDQRIKDLPDKIGFEIV